MNGLLHPDPIRLFPVMWESGLFLNCNVYWDCPTGCRYCFAHLQREAHNVQGKTATNKALGTLTHLVNKAFGPRYDEADAVQFFLHEGYPVMVSNNSDPLSDLEVEHGYALQYLQVLADIDSPVNLLSKWQGWDRLDHDKYLQVFSRFTKFWPAITFTADNDESLQKWEPGAPTYGQRLAIIRELADAGHWVDVRVIPVRLGDSFPNGEWDDPDTYRPFLEAIREAGASAVSMSPLEFSRYDAHVLDATCKQYVKDVEWSRSEFDSQAKYYLPDVSIWAEVTRVWHETALSVGLRSGVHQSFNSLVSDDLSCAVVGPEWHDLKASWVRCAHDLRAKQREYGTPIISDAQSLAKRQAEWSGLARREWTRDSWKPCMARQGTGDLNADALGKVSATVTVEEVLYSQLDRMGRYADCIWSDVATAPVDPGDGSQLCIDGAYLLSYDCEAPRDSWAACRYPDWNGRTSEDLSESRWRDGTPLMGGEQDA